MLRKYVLTISRKDRSQETSDEVQNTSVKGNSEEKKKKQRENATYLHVYIH